MNKDGLLGYDALRFEFGVFEVHDPSDELSGYLQVVDHLSDFIIADFLDDLRSDDD